jgi:hypothetical protein
LYPWSSSFEIHARKKKKKKKKATADLIGDGDAVPSPAKVRKRT